MQDWLKLTGLEGAEKIGKTEIMEGKKEWNDICLITIHIIFLISIFAPVSARWLQIWKLSLKKNISKFDFYSYLKAAEDNLTNK